MGSLRDSKTRLWTESARACFAFSSLAMASHDCCPVLRRAHAKIALKRAPEVGRIVEPNVVANIAYWNFQTV
jgi:hypothetical protein